MQKQLQSIVDAAMQQQAEWKEKQIQNILDTGITLEQSLELYHFRYYTYNHDISFMRGEVEISRYASPFSSMALNT